MENKEPNGGLGLSWRGIEEAIEELKKLDEDEGAIKDRRNQIKTHIVELQKKLEEANVMIDRIIK